VTISCLQDELLSSDGSVLGCIHAWYVSKRQLIDLYMKLKARIHSIQYVEGTYITDQ